MIEYQHASVTYPNGVLALREANFQIGKGEFVFFVGPSGQGKSTALKLVYREIKASEGHVLVEGHDVGVLSGIGVARLRRRIGVVFQDFRLLEHKTLRENLKFAMQVVDTPMHIIRHRVNDLLEQVGLADRRHAFPQQLSGGEQQRLCIARALINHPPLLVADEPTGNLDPETSGEIIKLLEQINLKGTTVVMATHDREIVDKLRKRVIYFCDGRIAGDEPEGSYYQPPVCVMAESGTPATQQQAATEGKAAESETSATLEMTVAETEVTESETPMTLEEAAAENAPPTIPKKHVRKAHSETSE